MTAAESLFVFPTVQQQAAINELKDIGKDRVIAWLVVIRSIEPGFRHRSGALSSPQLNALDFLRDCSDSNITSWLQCVTLAGKTLWASQLDMCS